MPERWNRLPEWARWVLYLPAIVLLPTVLMVALLIPGTLIFSPGEIGKFLLRTAAGTAATGLFIALCFELPPRSKITFGWALFAIASLLNAGEILWCIHILVENGFDWGRVGAVAQTSIWFLVGIGTANMCSFEYKSRA